MATEHEQIVAEALRRKAFALQAEYEALRPEKRKYVRILFERDDPPVVSLFNELIVAVLEGKMCPYDAERRADEAAGQIAAAYRFKATSKEEGK